MHIAVFFNRQVRSGVLIEMMWHGGSVRESLALSVGG